MEWAGPGGEESRAGEDGGAPPRPGESRHQNSQGKEERGEGDTHPEGGLVGPMVGAVYPGLRTRQLGLPAPLPIELQLAHTFPLDLTMSLLAPWG